jgi:hypothetical protein
MNFWARARAYLTDDRFLLCFFAFTAVVASLHRCWLGPTGEGHTHYENYVIFRNAFPHLWAGLNPYAAFPAEQWDLFKYSPTFALTMAPFSPLPDWLGLSAWNLLNVIPLAFALLALPLDGDKKYFVAWFVWLELLTALQSSQSNGLMAGLMLWAWVAAERRQAWLFGFCVAAAFFIKIFGVFCLLPVLLYAQRWRHWAWTLGWSIFLAFVPAFFIGWGALEQNYRWWFDLLRNDQAVSLGISVQGILYKWFGLDWSKSAVALGGLALLAVATLSPYWRRSKTDVPQAHKVLAWAGLLLWVVIFNHKAESPTYVIAAYGVGLWYVCRLGRAWELYLLIGTFVLVSLSPTDIFPRTLRENFVQAYYLKALPCIIVWALCVTRLFRDSGYARTLR